MDDEPQPPVALAKRKHKVLAGQLFGDERHVDLLTRIGPAEVDVLQVELSGESLGDIIFLGITGFDQSFADALVGVGRQRHRLRELLRVDLAPLNKDFADFLALASHSSILGRLKRRSGRRLQQKSSTVVLTGRRDAATGRLEIRSQEAGDRSQRSEN